MKQDSRQKKLLLLGGSTQQLIAIQKAKELGIYTVLCDYLPDNPGQYIVDKFYQVSTTDVNAVCEVAKKEAVDGILPYCSDPAALPASIVCSRLNLPSNPFKSVEILGLKYRFREFLKNNGFVCPNFFVFNSNDSIKLITEKIKNLKYPCLIKPTDSSGSKGISIIHDESQLEAAIVKSRKFSRNGIFVCEEYIKRGYPYIIEVELYVERGKIEMIAYTISLRDKSNKGLLPLGYLWSSELPDGYKEKIKNELQRIIDILDIEAGEMNSELIINENNEVQFIEIAPRAGGNMIPIVLSDAFKFDLVRAQINTALGIPSGIKGIDKEIDGKYCLYVLHSLQSGRFVDINIDNKVKPFVYRVNYYIEKGEQVEAYDNAWNAIGMMFLHFPDTKTAASYYLRLDELIKVVVE